MRFFIDTAKAVSYTHLDVYKRQVWQVEVPMKCRMKRLIYSYSDGYTIEDEEYLVDDGEVAVSYTHLYGQGLREL